MIVFFDFDGTLTTRDSLPHFIQFAVGKPSYYLGLLKLSPMLVLYKLNFIDNHSAKQRLITYFFKNWDSQNFKNTADSYALEKIDNIINPRMMDRLQWHQEQGHIIVIVSASIECWLKKWCEKHANDLIATRLEIRRGKVTGRFSTKNCYGIEKLNRIKERYKLSDYDVIYAYGDSQGDKEMLEIADKKYYKYFD